jgi:hypothetical protein
MVTQNQESHQIQQPTEINIDQESGKGEEIAQGSRTEASSSQTQDNLHQAAVDPADIMRAPDPEYNRKVDRFLTSVTAENLEELRRHLPDHGQQKASDLCNMILFSRGELPDTWHSRLASEYREAGITVGEKEVREAILEIRNVLNGINLQQPRDPSRSENSIYDLRERIDNLHYLAFR